MRELNFKYGEGEQAKRNVYQSLPLWNFLLFCTIISVSAVYINSYVNLLIATIKKMRGLGL